jgi:hypothetical protein
VPADAHAPDQARIAFEVSSVPLSDTISCGRGVP